MVFSRDVFEVIEAELEMLRKVFVPAEQVSVHLEDSGEDRYQGIDVADWRLDLHVARGLLELEIRCFLGVAKLQKNIVHHVVQPYAMSEERVDRGHVVGLRLIECNEGVVNLPR